MIKKVCLIFVGILLGAFLGYQLVYARIRPGVNRPFNPPAYYSETEISYADSPSTFFFRDLAAHGGNVFDKTRKLKSELFLGDFVNLANVFIQKTGNDITNTSPLSKANLEKTTNNIININQNTANIAKSKAVMECRSGNLFRSPDRYDEDTNKYDKKEQLLWLDKIYLSFVQASKDSLADMQMQEEALGLILENAYRAGGDLQGTQVSAQIQGMNEALQVRRNNLLANYVALKATKNMAREDEELESIRKIDNSIMKISDPYKHTQLEQNIYERPKAPGFKNF